MNSTLMPTKSEKQVCRISSHKGSSVQQQQSAQYQEESASPILKRISDLNESAGYQDVASPSILKKVDKFYLYLNQVGGHSTFLKPVDDRINFIAKPVQCKELEFYESLMKTKNMNRLRKFLPKYYGTVEISNSTQIVINKKNSVPNKNSTESLYTLNQESKSQWLQSLFSKRFKYGSNSIQYNFIQFSSQNSYFNTIPKEYMKLQDLTKNKKFPCILDIKMGFKATSQKDELKFENSTSSQVGFRICGMNVYQPLKKYAIFKDKYWGRQIQQQSLESSVASFFYDGEQIRFGLIQMFIKQLKELKRSLQYYKGYKFHSSSLLLIYDGIYTSDQFKIQEKSNKKAHNWTKNSQVSASFNYSINSTNIDKISGFYTQKLQKKEVQFNEPNQFVLEKGSADQMKYKPLLLQKLKRRSSAFQYNFNSISQQISHFSDAEKKKLTKTPIISSEIRKNNQSQSKEESKDIMNQQDLLEIVNQINMISKTRSDSSDSSESSISAKNASIDGYSQYEEEEEDEDFGSSYISSNSSDSLNHSFLSQGSNGNCKSNTSFSGQNKTDTLNKSYISSYSQECHTFKQSKPRSILKLIDFANIEFNENVEEYDQQLVKGIENLIELLTRITQKEISASFVIQNQQLFNQNEGEIQNKRRSSFNNNETILDGINLTLTTTNSQNNEFVSQKSLN